ncbi:LOG family protein YvdD [Phycisphaerae bacterium RAS1]|nr:LOG family protein YvdD [Phycisphaerae bacterium RAS1]
MREIRRLCVFCGSSNGANPAYADAARRLGRRLAAERIRLVYGGGNVGLMGVLADEVLAHGGEVIGVIPHGLAVKEVAHESLTELHVVDSMHTRKAMMEELADGFIALPGGLGTFEEIFEIITWAQLGIHSKPCGILNAAGYYDKLIEFLDHAVAERLVRREHRAMIQIEQDEGVLLDRMRKYEPPQIEKWIRVEQA